MDMEVMMPSPPVVEFNFDSSACTSPFISPPSSPQPFGNFYFSAPTSPTHARSSSPYTIPFNWEEKPGTPKHKTQPLTPNQVEENTDFAFDFSGRLEKDCQLSAADELFDGGKIKALKPPPRFHYSDDNSPKSPKSPKNLFRDGFSFSPRKKDFDPFSEALKQTTSEQPQRGRPKTQTRHQTSRSLSPFRVSDMLFDEENNDVNNLNAPKTSWYNKWSFKNILLFRSASEGSAAKKYAVLRKGNSGDVRNSSFRSTESMSVGGSARRRVSAHEMIYTSNRAVAEEMRRKTSLPYKQGLLGCLGISRRSGGASVHELSRSFGSSVQRGYE